MAARALGPDGRGDLAAIVVWTSVILYAGTLGFPEAAAYFAGAHPDVRSRGWTTAQLCSVVVGIATAAVAWWMLPLVFSGEHARRADMGRLFAVAYIVPGAASLSASAWLQGHGRFNEFNWARVSVPATQAAGFLLLLVFNVQTVSGFLGALLVGNAAGWMVAAAFGPLREAAVAGPSIELAKRMFSYGWRVQVGNWANAATTRLDQLLLAIVSTAASLGLYVVAVNYASLLMAVPASAAFVMFPKLLEQHRNGGVRTLVGVWYRRLLWTTGVGAAAMMLSSAALIPFLFGSAFRGAVPVAILLGPATMILGMNHVLSTAFRSVNRPDIASRSELLGFAVTAAALALLLPAYDIYGAAMASVLAYTSVHAYMLWEARRVFGTDLRSWCVPTREDAAAVRALLMRVRMATWRRHRAVPTEDL